MKWSNTPFVPSPRWILELWERTLKRVLLRRERCGMRVSHTYGKCMHTKKRNVWEVIRSVFTQTTTQQARELMYVTGWSIWDESSQRSVTPCSLQGFGEQFRAGTTARLESSKTATGCAKIETCHHLHQTTWSLTYQDDCLLSSTNITHADVCVSELNMLRLTLCHSLCFLPDNSTKQKQKQSD